LKLKKVLTIILAASLAVLGSGCVESVDPSSTETTGTTGTTAPVADDYKEPEYDLPDSIKMDKGILLYMGYNGNFGYPSDKLYETYTEDDIRKLKDSGVEQFVLLPTGAYNYVKADDESTAVLLKSDVDAITQDMLGTTNALDMEKIKGEFNKSLDATTGGPQRGMDWLVEEYITLTNRILSVDSDADIWYSFPDVLVYPIANKYTDVFIEHILNALKAKLPEDVWNKNVGGFYYCSEAVVAWYTAFDTSNKENFGNNMVQGMRDLSNAVHRENKKFLWIPYYQSGGEHQNAFRIGNIANTTNIFDFVCIQPNYYFDARKENWVTAVESIVADNMVKDHNGKVMAGGKTSKTQIGPEMEIDERAPNADYIERFQKYVDAYKKYVGKAPMVFYAGDRNATLSKEVLEQIAIMYK